ncbi:MAG: hypothetical protein ABIH04_00470 [Planctomycetota bacterium]
MPTELCNAIYALFLSGIKGTSRELFDSSSKLLSYFVRYPATPDSIESVFELERKLITARGPHKQFIEERIFQSLSASAFHCAPEPSGKKSLTLNTALLERTTAVKEKQKIIIALKLVGFSEGIFQLRNPRDAFNSKRKSLALDLLGRIAAYYDVPEAIDLCRVALASHKKPLVLAAVDFYENYTRNRHVSLPPEIIRLLNEVITKTKNRSVAVAALNVQVVSGAISEMGALSMIDDWKDRNRY